MFIIFCKSKCYCLRYIILGLKIWFLVDMALTLQRKEIEKDVSSEIRYSLYCRKSAGIRYLSVMP